MYSSRGARQRRLELVVSMFGRGLNLRPAHSEGDTARWSGQMSISEHSGRAPDLQDHFDPDRDIDTRPYRSQVSQRCPIRLDTVAIAAIRPILVHTDDMSPGRWRSTHCSRPRLIGLDPACDRVYVAQVDRRVDHIGPFPFLVAQGRLASVPARGSQSLIEERRSPWPNGRRRESYS